ncbi:MAG: hypothetical protein JSU63_03100 [Phycisphaerales bacterium]|nr:MAG: hypothetical protein JSU63_03100 [Phycisphaerales bacterium]
MNGAYNEMIDLDVSQLAPDIANLLMLRGADLPPLEWHCKPVQAAKDMLDRITDDTALFKRDPLGG